MKVNHFKWIERGSFNMYGSNRIFKIHEGNGENLLIVQGFRTSTLDWFNVINLLTKRFRVLLPDFLGLGFSDKPKRYNYSLEDSINQIIYLLKKNRIKTLHILAHDSGIEITYHIIRKIRIESLGIRILSLSLILDGSPEMPKPYFWKPNTPFWVKIPPISPKSISGMPLSKKENLEVDNLKWKFISKDLIPIGLALVKFPIDRSQIFMELYHTQAPISILLTNHSTKNLLDEIDEIRLMVPNVNVCSFPDFIGRFPIEEHAKSLADQYLKFYNSIQ